MKKLIGLLALVAPLAYAVNGPVIKPNSNLSVTSIRFPDGTVQVSSPTSTSPNGNNYSIQISSGGVFTGVPLTIKATGNAGDTQNLNLNGSAGAQINWNTLDGVSNIGTINMTLSAQNMGFSASNSVILYPGFDQSGHWEFDKHGVFTLPAVSTMSATDFTLNASTITLLGGGAPANGQALCLSNGHLGHCTSVVGVGGTCTCVAP